MSHYFYQQLRFDLGFDFIDPSRSSRLIASTIPANQHLIKIPIHKRRLITLLCGSMLIEANFSPLSLIDQERELYDIDCSINSVNWMIHFWLTCYNKVWIHEVIILHIVSMEKVIKKMVSLCKIIVKNRSGFIEIIWRIEIKKLRNSECR